MAAMDQVISAHQAIKDARTAKRRAWEKEDLALEEDMNKLKRWMLEQLNATGAKSVSTDKGTVYRREVLKPSAADWGAIWTWAKEHDAMEIFEKRLKAGFITEYMEENGGALPPGVNAHREFEVAVRRPTSDGRSASDTNEEPHAPE